MSSRRTEQSDQSGQNSPLPDPEAIIRANRQAARLAKQAESQNQPSEPDPNAKPDPETKPDTTASQPANFPQTPSRSRTDSARPPLPTSSLAQLKQPTSSMSDQPSSSADAPGMPDLVRLILESQLAGNKRMEKIEDAFLKLTEIQTTAADASTSLPREVGSVDLTRFRTADGPSYKGPYHDTKAFLTWFSALKTFYQTKGVILDEDRIILTGNYLVEPNAHAFYEGAFERLIKGSWHSFVKQLFAAALPGDWLDKLYEKAQHLKMSPYEDFKAYSTRARTIQNLINYEDVTLDDHQLAKFVEFGMPDELKTAVKLWGYSKFEKNFAYHAFESKVETLYDSLTASRVIVRKTRAPITSHNFTRAPTTIPLSRPRLSDEEFAWKIHSYLDLLGKCHFCKGYCGSEHRACKGPYVKERVVFPPGYVAPPKPANYVPPRARTAPPTSQPTAGRATLPPAGRPPTTYAKVAATTEFPELDQASIAALQALDEELNDTEAEGESG